MKRVATALVLIPTVTWIVLAGNFWLFASLLTAVGLLAFREFDRIVRENGLPGPGWLGMGAGLVLMLAPNPGVIAVLITILAMTIALRFERLEESLAGAAVFLFGVVYIFGAWRCAIELRNLNPHWLMFALLLSWAGDTAAMYIGKTFGRHRLAPRVSPGKTWEGAIGSVAGALLAGVLYAHYLIPSASIPLVLALAAAGNIAGQVGDLCESALKRGAGVKDSGTSLPGHGGWLDRIDSSLFSIPVVYAILLAKEAARWT